MNALSVLVLPENDGQYNPLVRAIQSVGVGGIQRANSGDEAISWPGLTYCDVCVISYELRGKRNGLDTLLDLRAHRPDLAAIMVSRSGREAVAVGAFHAGVVDYIPVKRGYEEAVAGLISQLKVSRPDGQVVRPQVLPPGVHDSALTPTYQNRLRVIGRHLDQYHFHSVNILEVEGGFIVRASVAGRTTVETLEFVDNQFPQLLANAVAARGEGERQQSGGGGLLPTGYEDFLRAVGYELDQRAAEAVTISQLDQLALVGGVGRIDTTAASRHGQLQWLYRGEDVVNLLDSAYRRRKTADKQKKKSGSGILRRLSG